MAFASTFRNIAFSASLATVAGMAQSAPTPSTYRSPETVNLENVLNAKQPSKAHSEAFFRATKKENFGLTPEYVFSVTQRCKKVGAVSQNEFVDCARSLQFNDRVANAFLGLGTIALVSISGCLLASTRKRPQLAKADGTPSPNL
jgi:hypothetical protein